MHNALNKIKESQNKYLVNLYYSQIQKKNYKEIKNNVIRFGSKIRDLEKRHPKEHETFEIPEQTIFIKGNFSLFKTNEPKSSSYHKLVQSQCGDDNVQSGNGQTISSSQGT